MPEHPVSAPSDLAVRQRRPTGSPLANEQTDARTVLIADDDPATRLLVEVVLGAERDLRVRSACGGRAAIQALAEARPDLVLLDLKMSDMDGFAVLRWMRAHVQTADVPVIVLTADGAGVNHALACGCVGSVKKPLEMQTLLEVVLTRLAGI